MILWEEIVRRNNRAFALETLTHRELQVLILMGRGKTPMEMGIILYLSRKTIANHKTNILRKMGIENNYEIIRYCIRAEMDSDKFMDKHL